MADNDNAQDQGSQTPEASLAQTIEKLGTSQEAMAAQVSELSKTVTDLSKAREQEPSAAEGGFNVRRGENIMESRPYSICRVAKRLAMQKSNDPNFRNYAKQESELSDELQKHYCGSASWDGFAGGRDFVIPLGSEFLPMTEIKTEEGEFIPAVPSELVQKCRQMMVLDSGIDIEELRALGLPIRKSHLNIQKDMSGNTATTGGVLVPEAAQGELIEILRAAELMSQVGARQLTLPSQGAINFPRVSSSVTVAATTEGATISESTPGFGQLRLQAKPYSSLTDIPEELLKFASVNVEAWLRAEMLIESALKIDRDCINGAGGNAINGIVNYSAVTSRNASTTAANGDTLNAKDPILLAGDLSDANAPVDNGTFFYAMRGALWAGLVTRQEGGSANSFLFNLPVGAAAGVLGGKTMHGEKVVTSTQIPADRAKGSGTTLTLLLAGVGSEWIMARAGVVAVSMTDSDDTKFQKRLVTMRSTVYVDGGPRHEESFGLIDTLLNS
jgi:HK97 family phage major capsid protein